MLSTKGCVGFGLLGKTNCGMDDARPANDARSSAMPILKFMIPMCLVGIALLVSSCNVNDATSCVATRNDSYYSLKYFDNICNDNINVTMCFRYGLAEIGEVFAMGQANWHCRSYFAGYGNIDSIIWAREDSSLLSLMAAASRYVFAACYSPTQPRFTEETSFVCE